MVFIFKTGVLSLITLRYFLVAGPFEVIVAHKFDFSEEQNKTTQHECTAFPGFVKTSLPFMMKSRLQSA